MSIATAIIDCQALRCNLLLVRDLTQQSQSKITSVVKANAYGHGLIEVAKITEPHVDYIAVARLTEAILLRNEGIIKPILLLEGFFDTDNIQDLVTYNLQTVIHSMWQLEKLNRVTLSHPITVWLKFDTGMHRLGVRPEQAEQYYIAIKQCQNIVQPIKFMTHFCCADEVSSPETLKQITLFNQLVNDKPGLCSLSASSGILAWPQAHRDIVRAGLVQYGVSPFTGKSAKQLGLKPVMTLTSSVIALRSHKAGECIGYSSTWASPKDTQLAVVAMGYGDGYPRNIPSATPVLIQGKEYPIVGRVSMDMIVVDIGLSHSVKLNDDVIFWGENLPIERIALHTGISVYELMTRLTSRIALVYINR